MLSRYLVGTAVAAGAVMAQNSTGSSGSGSSGVQPTEFVWGAVILNTFADRIPILAANYSVITPTGQNQMYQTGQLFRDRYVSPSTSAAQGNLAIQGLSPNLLNASQINITTMAEVWVQQSAQAFMEGLYPPLNDTVSVQTGGPLNSLQNPMYYIASNVDYNYLYLNGSENCPAFDASVLNWMQTSQFQQESSSSASVMQSVLGEFNNASLNVVPNVSSWFGSSYLIWDWLEHYALNESQYAADAQSTRYVADAYMQGVYGNLSADGGIRAIGGITLAAQVLGSLYAMIDTNGTYDALNLYFTGPEPWVSLGALLNLTNQAGAPWTGMPNPGSSLVFELFSSASTSTENLAGVNPAFPTLDNMQVRVLFRNGTNSTTNLDMQGMFGLPTSNGGPQAMLFNDFSNNMSAFAEPSAEVWCLACNAQNAPWCAYATDGKVGLPSGASSGSHSNGPVSPTIAGVIGALVALAVAGLTVVAAMLCFGLRFHRKGHGSSAPNAPTSSRFSAASGLPRLGMFGLSKSGGGGSAGSSPTKARGGLGGFKGGEKLASDVDLPGGAAPFGASFERPNGGHERTESWELREQEAARRRMSTESERMPREGL